MSAGRFGGASGRECLPVQQGAGERAGSDARAGRLEATQVRSMFDRIASIYDPLNTAMTAGLHHHWRRRAADLAQLGPGGRALDVACGTGDLALELVGRVGDAGEVVGCDFSENMLALAREKAEKRFSARPGAAAAVHGAAPSPGAGGGSSPGVGGANVRFEWADALDLPYADDSFDAATVGFGARNFSDLGKGLAEMGRVVRPGGRVVVLDFTTPTRPPLSVFFSVWFDRVVPLLGRASAALAKLRPRSAPEGRDGEADVTIADAYAYLPNSVKRFPGPAELAAEMDRLGLLGIRYVTTAGGIVVIHVATVPM